MAHPEKTHIIKAGQRIDFDGLPDGCYSAMGVNGSKAGDLYLMVFDQGTCLTPVMDEEGKQINYLPAFTSGKTYDKQTQIWR